MEKTTKASLFLVLIFLMAFLNGSTEGGRNIYDHHADHHVKPKKDADDQVYKPQFFWGWGLGLLHWPFWGLIPGFAGGGLPGVGGGPSKGFPGFGLPGFGIPGLGIPGFGGPGKGGDGPFPEAAINGVGGRKSP
ncbi:elastin-like isoform X1 [Juglans microcarpa x Juglans regia]|uniref:elastin-like isoform X1 n=1 Tax=Juglans microcarpa x Juglans regia TaxID=2249226 RepID=UPI001B7D9848|nr:elastin-like isoform X1 [Juglans microcarpa x Juglans regia]